MDKVNISSSVGKTIDIINNMSYNEKKDIFNIFSLGRLNSFILNDKIILISLIAFTHQKVNLKFPNTTTLDLLLKITNSTKDNSAYYQFLENLSILVEDLSYGCTEFSNCGLHTSKEITQKIKELLSSWTPF